jgi:hypothetical protein
VLESISANIVSPFYVFSTRLFVLGTRIWFYTALGRELTMVLLRGQRAQDALEKTNLALEHGEAIAARLNSSLHLLRERRDELAAKMIRDTELALTRQCEPQTIVPAQPVPPVRRWSYF